MLWFWLMRCSTIVLELRINHWKRSGRSDLHVKITILIWGILLYLQGLLRLFCYFYRWNRWEARRRGVSFHLEFICGEKNWVNFKEDKEKQQSENGDFKPAMKTYWVTWRELARENASSLRISSLFLRRQLDGLSWFEVFFFGRIQSNTAIDVWC